MTPGQQREMLLDRIAALTSSISDPRMAPIRDLDHDAPERAFLTELEQQLEEKKAQLNALDTQLSHTGAPRTRFHQECHRSRGLIWLGAVCMCLATVAAGAFLDSGLAALVGILTVGTLVWAVWSSSPPK